MTDSLNNSETCSILYLYLLTLFRSNVTGPMDSGFARQATITNQMSPTQSWTKMLDNIEIPCQAEEELSRRILPFMCNFIKFIFYNNNKITGLLS